MKRLALFVWLAGLALCIAIVSHTKLSTDMSAFLPGAPTPAQQVLVDQLHDGTVSRLILLGVTGAPVEMLAVLSKDLAKSLRAEPDFASVSNGEAGAFAADHEFLWKNRYLLSPETTPDRFTRNGLHNALTHDLKLLGSEMSGLVEPMIGGDPTGAMLGLIENFSSASHPATKAGVWVSKDSSRAVLLVQTRAAGFDIDAQQQGLQAIERDFAAAKQASDIGSAHLLETGPGVFAVHSRDRMKGDATRFSTIATLLVAAILLAAYRSPRVLVLALLPVASGALAGIAIVSLGYGYVHGITLGFGVTLIGEAVDYAIYLFTQTEPGAPPESTLPRIWPTLRLGMLTSVVGFAAMLFSSFTGFAQLGLFTIAGLVVALAVTRYILPQLLPKDFATRGSAMTGMAAIAGHLPKARPALAVVAVAAIGTLCFHSGGFWEDEISSMSPLSPAEQTLDRQLRQDTGAPDVRYLLAIASPDREQALQASETMAAKLRPLVAQGALEGFDSPSQYLPSEAAQKLRQAALPAPDTVKADLTLALAGLPFKPDIFQSFLSDVESARTQPLVTRPTLDGTALGLKVDTLLVQRSDGWMAMLSLHGVRDPAAVAAVASGSSGVLLDMKSESDNLLRQYRREAITLSLVGSVAIVALLSFSLRSLRRVALVLLPLALAVLVVTALVASSGKLSIFTLFGLLLTVAIGSNYCLFFEREKIDPAHHGRTVSSLVLANLCTVIGFGILSFSGIPVLHGIGGTVAIGAFLSLLFAAILIPPHRSAA